MSDLYSSYLGWKLILFFHTLESLAMAAVAVPIQMRISAVLVPSLDRVAPKYLKEVTVFDVGCGIFSAVDHHFRFFGADFHAVRSSTVCEPVSQLLQLVVASSNEVNVVGETQIAYWSATDGY